MAHFADESSVLDVAELGDVDEANGRDRGTKGIDAVLPGNEEDRQAVLTAFELDEAVYKLLYERSHQPDSVPIPRSDPEVAR